VACTPVSSSSSDAGTPSNADAGAPDAGPVDAGPTHADSGLDTRPANTTCHAPARPVVGGTITTTRVFPTLHLDLPVALVQAPGDGTRFFVVEKAGTVRDFLASDTAVVTPHTFVDLRDRVDASSNEAGLLGVAFHPDFAHNHEVYISYTATSQTSDSGLVSRISRFVSHDDGDTIDPSSEQILMTLEQPFTNHNGGEVLFGPDGYLYAGYGDGGSAGDPFENGQNTHTLFAKMLRIDVDTVQPPRAYGIPADNPFVGNDAFLPEIYSFGMRNPWRWSFDRGTGQLWVGDVGQDRHEEVDVVVAGGNYGWNVREGLACFNGNAACNDGGFLDPIVAYDHVNGRQSITGGYIYRGSLNPALTGTYLYADFATGEIFGLLFDAQGKPAPKVLAATRLFISSFAEDVDGELYVLQYNQNGGNGGIFRIDPAGPVAPDTFPTTLSTTGCFDPSDVKKPGPALIPYTVNHPLYSDGAQKERFVALPDGKTIDINASGDMDLPVGSVLIKHFRVDDKLVETRLLVHHDDGDWGGYSYKWNDDQSDAVLLPASEVRTLPSGKSWTYPSRNECLQCHTVQSGRSLGLDVQQQNGDLLYAQTNRIANQLRTWQHMGLFTQPLVVDDTLPKLPALDDVTVPVETRARAYLHVNCSNCHQPGGTGQGNADFRVTTSFADMHICNVRPQEGNLDVNGAHLLSPGAPERSLISLRMHRLSAGRMPLLGSAIVDVTGTQLIDSWITQTTACP
jgi:uncharacterized repeat protein (TIGR03806 family)